MKLKTWQKNVLSAVVIVAGGFLLWNIAFLMAYGVMLLYNTIRGPVSQTDAIINEMVWKYIFAALVLLISSAVFLPKKIPALIKATYLTMPLMSVLIIIGIGFYEYSKWIPISIGAVIIAGTAFFIYMRKLPWLYYFATAYTGIVALIVVLFDIQI
ncbi:MAG: hypothetical protein WCY62_06425 [Clostridia bacterium]